MRSQLFYEKLQEQFSHFKNAYLKKLEDLEVQFNRLMNQLKEEDNKLMSIEDQEQESDNIIQSIICVLNVEDNQIKMNYQKPEQQILRDLTLKLRSIQLSIQNQNILNSINKLRFTSKLMHENVNRINERKIQKKVINKQAKGAFSILVPKLSLTNKTTIGFKINKLNRGVAIGLVEKEVIMKNNFTQGKHYELGHGYYFLCNDGRIYNTNISLENDKSTHIRYQENDTVYVTFNPSKNYVKFTNPRTNQRIYLNVKRNDKTLYAGCSFLGENEQIELIYD